MRFRAVRIRSCFSRFKLWDRLSPSSPFPWLGHRNRSPIASLGDRRRAADANLVLQTGSPVGSAAAGAGSRGEGGEPELDAKDSAVGASVVASSSLENIDTAEHAKAALKIQNRARVKNAEKETARLKAEGKLPGQLRAKKIEEWGTAVFKKFDADADGKLTSKELASALMDLPKTKPKKAPPGVKFQSVEDMMIAMDSDSSGSLDLAEWLANLGQCPGLAAALAENVTVGEDTQEIRVSAEEVKVVGDMVAAGEIDMPSGEDAERAAVKIQSIARGKRDRARVDGIKRSGDGADGKTEEAAEAAGGDGAAGQGMLESDKPGAGAAPESSEADEAAQGEQ